MEKNFVTYEIALKLKDLGFDENCICFYNDSKELLYRNSIYNDYGHESIKEIDFYINKQDIATPLWQQVIDWFREKYNVLIEIKVGSYFDTFAESYSFEAICKVFRNGELDCTTVVRDGQNNHIFYSYYKVREQAILKAIELCQKK